jgi:hypothetical protein
MYLCIRFHLVDDTGLQVERIYIQTFNHLYNYFGFLVRNVHNRKQKQNNNDDYDDDDDKKNNNDNNLRAIPVFYIAMNLGF